MTEKKTDDKPEKQVRLWSPNGAQVSVRASKVDVMKSAGYGATKPAAKTTPNPA